MVIGKILNMPPLLKKPCENNPTYYYTGKESSPLGLGYDAGKLKVGDEMEGRDKTRWMIGMKNGVRVWVRQPNELVKDVPVIASTPKAPKKPTASASKKVDQTDDDTEIKTNLNMKFEGVADEVKEREDVEAPAPAAPVVKKKKAPVKKKQEIAPEPEPESEIQPVKDEEKAEEVAVPEKKKRAPAKKKEKVPEPEGNAEENKPEPKPKKPLNDFNIFMAYRIKQMGVENPDMKHMEKFAKVSSEWKTLTPEAKATIVAVAKAAKTS
jgi:hypothetical protein